MSNLLYIRMKANDCPLVALIRFGGCDISFISESFARKANLLGNIDRSNCKTISVPIFGGAKVLGWANDVQIRIDELDYQFVYRLGMMEDKPVGVVFAWLFSRGRFRVAVFAWLFSRGLEHDGALYVFDQFSADGLKKFWRCEFHGPADKCKGRLHTDSNNVVQKKVGVHSCDMNAARVECQRLVTGLKRRAAETCEAPGTIRAQVLQNTCTPVLAAFPSKYATKKVIKRLRRDENAPRAEPLNLEQLEIPNAYRVYNRIETEEEQFLLADTGVFQIQGQNGPQRILIFGRASTAVWTHEMKDIYADGTFALTPPLFSQIYVLLAKRDGWVFPICYCLLTSKCTAIYTRMLQLLLERWPNFAPQTISLDFELAMVGAVRIVLPACSVRYCFFHLVRNMKKKITALGLTRVYNTDPIFAEKSKMITSLAFLPVHHLQAGLNAIQAQLPAQLHGIFNWFLDNYTGKPWFNGAMTVPKFGPNEWSAHQRTLDGGDRTNNFAEAFHRKLQRQFNCTHPTIWRFIDTIRCVQKTIDADMARCVMGEAAAQKKTKYLNADARILRLVQRYNDINNNIVPQNDHNYANANVNPENINNFLIVVNRHSRENVPHAKTATRKRTPRENGHAKTSWPQDKHLGMYCQKKIDMLVATDCCYKIGFTMDFGKKVVSLKGKSIKALTEEEIQREMENNY
ncbi:hypothetical protein niasHT_034312 [Heterodera trifolii]|uniref:MULE transposase domain-containing protein n=1 Tax=Heterodera trifolii TaxID=157864 RepID=A0ABD2HPN0_9BILA